MKRHATRNSRFPFDFLATLGRSGQALALAFVRTRNDIEEIQIGGKLSTSSSREAAVPAVI